MDNDSVFFLGAGFSKAINNSYPDLKTLSQDVKDSYEKENSTVAIHYKKDVPEQYKSDIEILLTYLSGNLPYKTDVQVSLDEALYKDITVKIANKFYKIPNTSDMLRNCNKLIPYIWSNKCTCITLNYDTLLENLILNSMMNNDIDFPAGGCSIFYHYPINNFYKTGSIRYIDGGTLGKKEFSKNDLPNIIKLHGSINWYLTGYDNSAIVQYDDEKNTYLSPFIIPPILDKSVLYNNLTLKKCWNLAFETIKNAKRIFIYGFSFPQTDLAIRFLFQTALKENKNNPQIYVINTENFKNEAKKIYSKIFAGYEIDYEYCCENSLKLFNDNITL